MTKKEPNILLIVSDQHRMDCVGSYGNNEIQTPNIDELADEGVLYSNSFCAAPVCTPSRYSMLTGTYPHQHLGWDNHCTIPNGTETLPKLLKENGYRTKAVGKMHFTPTYLDVGFEEMELAEQNGEGRFEDDYHVYLKEREFIDEIDLLDQVEEFRIKAPQEYWDSFGAMESNLPEAYHSSSWIADNAIKALQKWEEKDSNFLMTSFVKPHHPFDPPYPWSQMYDPDSLSLLPGWTDSCLVQDVEMGKGFFPNKNLTEKQLKRIMAYYYGTISQIDKYVGEMVKVLKEKGLYENTIIIYTSDHGEYMGFHHLLLKGNYMYDPLMKVPLIVKYPHQVGKGCKSEELINNIDLAPTILECAGCQKGRFMPGYDFSKKASRRNFVFSEHDRGKQYMIRSKEYKLLLSKEESKCQFFDLNSDPLEMNNVYHDGKYSGIIEEFKQALLTMMAFEAPSPVHLDVNAPIVKAERTKPGKENIREWIQEKMNFPS